MVFKKQIKTKKTTTIYWIVYDYTKWGCVVCMRIFFFFFLLLFLCFLFLLFILFSFFFFFFFFCGVFFFGGALFFLFLCVCCCCCCCCFGFLLGLAVRVFRRWVRIFCLTCECNDTKLYIYIPNENVLDILLVKITMQCDRNLQHHSAKTQLDDNVLVSLNDHNATLTTHRLLHTLF